ncbi:DUF1444 domain-containing protein [Bacillus shivajii]|uniref:DUF1444 domain-containing protein n=1 Tax=Bacillus shivajii TaxID=1983719 RepID=UPI001CF94FA5|nr:DUF1444 domain-containing protein [Bacillus shivajii]UCZ52321.1 DUF1444 domain-containing protein [Bacillus shivajii]
MKPIQIKRAIESKITDENWVTTFDREKETLRIVDKRYDKGVTLNLTALKEKFQEDEKKAVEQTMANVSEGLRLLNTTIKVKGNEKNLYPVIRSTSFPTELEDGRKLLYKDHTAETRIFYAVDQGASFSLIDEETLKNEEKTFKEIEEAALFNVRSLKNPMKQDEVAGNIFYFLNNDDGYDASRILNETLLKEMKTKVSGDLAVAVPHQDVLIFADIRNEVGYDILAQMVFQFFSEGRVPITALPFMYENEDLEPIFILAQRKPKGSTKK